MKYTDRKNTPLKWHHFLTYIGMPLITLSAIYNLIGLINELFGLRLGHMNYVLKPIVEGYGASISNLGGCFWYVVGYFIVRVLVTILLIYVCMGFFQWKEEARKGWLYYLLIQSVETGLVSFTAFALYRHSSEQFVKIYTGFLKYNGGTVLASSSVLLAVLMLYFVIAVIMLILNYIYYSKRKSLFTATYVAPENAGMVNAAAAPVEEKAAPVEEPAAVQENCASEDTAADAAPVQEEPQPVETAETETVAPVEEPAKEAVPAEDTKEEQPEEKPEAVEEQKPVMKFCPNCGAELTDKDVKFCTHCGTKLN